MGSDLKQSLAAAEKLLKADKVDQAIAAFDRVVENSKGDLLTVNRVGDAIVSAGHPEKAVPYYSRIADQFSRQGFYPKAIAIRKKILRLTPESAEALVGLGDLYVRQEHPAEARSYFLRAAEHLLTEKDFTGAQEVYQRLVESEPDDPRHRVRLAETRAAGGDVASAAEELVDLGQRLLQSGKPEDAEKSFRRAGEWAPDRPDVVSGLIACLTETGRDDEALKLLQEEVAKPNAAIELVAELLILYEVNGRTDEADAVLTGEKAQELPLETFRTIVRFHDRKNGLDALWARLEPAMKAWDDEAHKPKLIELLDGWSEWTEAAYVPALERRLVLADADSDERAQIGCLERLIEAHGASGDSDAAKAAEERLHVLRPPVVEPDPAPAAEGPAEAAADETAAPGGEPAPDPEASGVDVPVEYEAPAVPLSRADEEFVSGRMTQAEILEKYGLVSQAMDQIYEVIERFPGHLEANQHLVTLLRGTSQDKTLAQALVKLALARRAAGRLEVGRQAAEEADRLGGIDAQMRTILAALGLLDGENAVPAGAPATRAAAPQKRVDPASATEAPAGASESVIDFDSLDEEEDEESPEAVEERPAGPPAEEPHVEQVAAAEEQPAAAPAAEEPVVAAAEQPAPAQSRGTESAMRFEPLPAVVDDQDDDDLRAIAAALDDDLFEDDPLDEAPASESEESLDEVFAAFRERVEEEVGADDFRTHYDLGIGYKEMGLLDAAVAEFELCLESPELSHEACVMLAMCCREMARFEAAADWYRKALQETDEGKPESFGLRYDLADVLSESGETGSALDLFRGLQELDPGFRDVSERVSQLIAAVSD